MCIDCRNPLEPGRAPNSRRCRPCLVLRNRAKAKAWYNRDPDKTIARARAWDAAHRERERIYQRDWKRARRPVKACETVTCGKPLEIRQRKFCRACNEFYRREVWHTWKSRRAA